MTAMTDDDDDDEHDCRNDSLHGLPREPQRGPGVRPRPMNRPGAERRTHARPRRFRLEEARLGAEPQPALAAS